MKKLTLIIFLFIISVHYSGNLFAQTPDGINYQAILRSSNGDVIENQSVTIKFIIQRTIAPLGPQAVYQGT